METDGRCLEFGGIYEEEILQLAYMSDGPYGPPWGSRYHHLLTSHCEQQFHYLPCFVLSEEEGFILVFTVKTYLMKSTKVQTLGTNGMYVPNVHE